MAPSDLITLENLEEKLPKWHPDEESHLHAIVDMGSNGIRFSVVSLAPPRTRLLSPLFSSRAAISLFDSLEGTDPNNLRFPPQTIESVASAVAGFRRIAARYNVPPTNIILLATEAMRRASNAGDMMAAIEVATNGLHVQILEPAVETLLGAVMGSRSGLADVQGGALFLDLGGGSVQMTWVDTAVEGYEIHAAKAGNSLPFGAAKLKRILDNLTGETQLLELGKLSVGMQDSYKRLCATFPALDAIRTAYENGDTSSLVNVYMCGGGFRGYGSMLMHDDPIKPYPIPSINSYTVDGDRFKQIARMRQINQEYEGKIPGLSTRRRSQFPAIAAVIETFTQTVPNIGRVTFCGGSNREGLLMMKLPKQIREDHPLHVLGPANAGDMLLCKAVLQKLSTALPQGLDLSRMPTILSTGLGPLWAGELWSRQGYDANTNASFALHNALIRDSDCPGLSHLTRALLAVTSVARWGCNPAPVDSDLYKGLRRVADSHTPNASFWALYIGVVSGILTTILPTAPVDVQQLDTAIRFDSRCSNDTANLIELTITVSPESAEGINFTELVDRFKFVSKKNGDKKAAWKVAARITNS